jgi:hypothetical protein
MPGIEGKVAKIIDEYTVVINKGSDNGVEENMRFIIYEKGKEIIDPDSKESLGYFEYVKGKVKVDIVNEKYSIAKSYHQAIVGVPNYFNIGAIAPKELPLDEETKKGLEKSGITIVKEGDLVRQILD